MELEFKDYTELETYIDNLDEDLSVDVAVDSSGRLKQLCKFYRTVKPILTAILSFILIPEKFKIPIRTLMGLLDGLCPTD